MAQALNSTTMWAFYPFRELLVGSRAIESVTLEFKMVEGSMATELEELIERARKIEMSDSDLREQRRSFVFGNTNIENARITRELVNEVDAQLEARGHRK